MSCMRKRLLSILPLLSCILTLPAFAGWQYAGDYISDGWYEDDGSRFTLAVRGGFALGMASVENHVGAIATGYMVSPDLDEVASIDYCNEYGCPSDWLPAYTELADVPVRQDYDSFSFAAGFGIGWTMPYTPQWRFEAGWDHIVKSEYNSSPMFSGDAPLYGIDGVTIPVQSGSVNSHLTTDVISVMAYHDYFDGLYKPVRTAIPYVGFGIGYADVKTVLNLSDPYGDIAYQEELKEYGEIVDGKIEFYQSEYSTANFAGLLAAGVSYGVTERMFFDFGGRIMYIPNAKWELGNVDNTKHREFFSANNLVYINLMLGLRFEF